jgi:hypothetical protein
LSGAEFAAKGNQKLILKALGGSARLVEKHLLLKSESF